MRGLTIIAFLMLAPVSFAQDAVTPVEIEIQAREVGRSLRCVVCQNQSIEDSDAMLAADMRSLVRARLTAGDSPEAVTEFMRVRYGDYVLLKPPVQTNTYILWFAPFALVMLLGGWALWPRGAKVQAAFDSDLSSDDAAQLQRLKDEMKL